MRSGVQPADFYEFSDNPEKFPTISPRSDRGASIFAAQALVSKAFPL